MRTLLSTLFMRVFYGRDFAIRRLIRQHDQAVAARESAFRVAGRVLRLVPGEVKPSLGKITAEAAARDELWDLIERFREDELCTLILLPVNVECTTGYHHVVELESDATAFKSQRFEGRTLLEALRQAAAVQDAYVQRIRETGRVAR